MKKFNIFSIVMMLIVFGFGFISCNNEVNVIENENEQQTVVETVTVSYESDYGTAPETITVNKNTVLSADKLPVINGTSLVFKGWFIDENKIEPDTYLVRENVTLTAHWANTVTVNFNSLFGNVPNAIEEEVGETVNIVDMSYNNYEFLGWFDSEDENHNGTGNKVEGSIELQSDINLYACWKIATITFNSTVPTTVNKFVGQTLTVEEIPQLTKNGYSFNGWFNGSTKLTSNYVVSDDVAFDESWTIIEYHIVYHVDGGTLPENVNTVYTIEDAVELVTPTKDKRIFAGWHTTADCYVKNQISGWNAGKTGDVDLYAFWAKYDSSNIEKIYSSSEDCIIAGEFTYTDLTKIAQALDKRFKYYYERREDIPPIRLDLSHVTVKSDRIPSLYGSMLKSIKMPDNINYVECAQYENLEYIVFQDTEVIWDFYVGSTIKASGKMNDPVENCRILSKYSTIELQQ